MVERSERPNKRLRRLSTDYDDSEGTDDWIPSKDQNKDKADAEHKKNDAYATNRPRRSGGKPVSSVTVERPPATVADDAKRSIHLTVKVPASKLREATSGSSKKPASNPRDRFVPGEIVTGPRGTRARRTIIEESASDEEEEEEEEEDGEEEDVEGDEENGDEDMDEDAEGDSDNDDADGDVEMADVPPPPPVIKSTAAPPGSKPILTVTPAEEGKLKSVESKEMEDDDDDDEELSELASDDDEEGSIEGDENPEGEDGREEDVEDDEGEELSDDDDATPATGSRASTPDISKLTRRQRMRMDEITGGELLELPSGMVPCFVHSNDF
ncbi:MAG: hypothetical protein M1837_005879 [Sclerophora amabilis]|nr:MAG: hypothetical protein M1837_005879 [Sclerophora amabilis]